MTSPIDLERPRLMLRRIRTGSGEFRTAAGHGRHELGEIMMLQAQPATTGWGDWNIVLDAAAEPTGGR